MGRYTGAWLSVAGFVVAKFGPTPERIYWVALSALFLRYAVTLWLRMRLSWLPAGTAVAALALASFAFIGGSHEGANEAIGAHWRWYVGALVVMVLLFYWEGRRSPKVMGMLKTATESATVRDFFTLRHIPDLREGPTV